MRGGAVPALQDGAGGTRSPGALCHVPAGAPRMREAGAEHGLPPGTLLREVQGLPKGSGLRAGVRAEMPDAGSAARHDGSAFVKVESIHQ